MVRRDGGRQGDDWWTCKSKKQWRPNRVTFRRVDTWQERVDAGLTLDGDHGGGREARARTSRGSGAVCWHGSSGHGRGSRIGGGDGDAKDRARVSLPAGLGAAACRRSSHRRVGTAVRLQGPSGEDGEVISAGAMNRHLSARSRRLTDPRVTPGQGLPTPAQRPHPPDLPGAAAGVARDLAVPALVDVAAARWAYQAARGASKRARLALKEVRAEVLVVQARDDGSDGLDGVPSAATPSMKAKQQGTGGTPTIAVPVEQRLRERRGDGRVRRGGGPATT